MIVMLLICHVIFCVVLYLLMRASVLKSTGTLMPVVCLVPVWGAAALLILELRIRGSQEIYEEVGIEKLKINDAVHKSILMDEDPVENRVVPLEEAFLINNPATRRELLMEVMYADPNDYVEQLKEARENDDTEVVHYAVTALAELQKDYETKFQKLEWRLHKDPGDGEAVDAYLELLRRYLLSGIAEGSDRKLKRKLYSHMLEKKLREQPDRKGLWQEKAKVDLKIGAYEDAKREIAHILKKWSSEETGYLLQIRYCAAMGDRAGIEKMLGQIRERGIYLTPEGREEVRFWRKEEETQED